MERRQHPRARRLLVASSSAVLALALAAPAGAHDDPTDDPDARPAPGSHTVDHDAGLRAADETEVVSDGPTAKVTRNLNVAGRGERLGPNVTTDVWAHDGYAYTGTFSALCSDGPGGNESGIWVWDVHNPTQPQKVGVIESAEGTKANDVKVASMNSGDILVMSNEVCGDDGPGGVDVYDVDDPENPVFLSRIQVDDANAVLRALGVIDTGVHNMYLFTQGDRDLVGVSGEGDFGNFQIFDITDPTDPTLVSTWGPENAEFADELADFGLESFAEGDADFWFTDGWDLLLEADGWLFSGFGASANRIMHDLYVTDDGTQAYVNFWDAGLVLLDITDPADPVHVSTALDQDSEDGEVNSHSVWPTADGTVVVEGEEDFAPYEARLAVDGVGDFLAATGAINTSGDVSGPTTYVGLACDGGDPVPTASGDGQVALIQRGVCAFTEKGLNVIAAGYDAMVVFNDEARGDGLVTMGGDDVDIPGVFVGHSAGLAIMGVASADDLVIGASGPDVATTQVWNGWSGLRLWDYSDPEHPVLASTFNTPCSAIEDAEGCLEGGTYSSHNVIVEGDLAYVSWYADGVLVLDISDPYHPVEVARYHERGEQFEEQNGGPQDVWGVYKEPRSPWIYASDRNGGLYVLKAYGSGSAKQGRSGKG